MISVLRISRLKTGLRFARELLLRSGPAVIVYQVGKVGSTSIANSLQARGFRVFKLHALYPAKTSRQIRSRLVHWRFVRPSSRNVKIITLIRDPIARNCSDFFQNPQRYLSVSQDSLTTDELIAEFEEHFEHRIGIDWFEREFEPTLDIDIYSYDFDPEKGYSIIKDRGWEILVLQLELGDAVKQAALEEFMGVVDIPIVRENVSVEKDYSDIYREFVRSFQPSDDYVQEMYGSKLATHFYSAEQLRRFERRWRASSPAEVPDSREQTRRS